VTNGKGLTFRNPSVYDRHMTATEQKGNEMATETMAGEVFRRVNRQTGTRIVLLDGDNGGDWAADDERWVLLCDEHGNLCTFETRRQAESFAAAPDEWCPNCQERVHGMIEPRCDQ
jgi:hypothetical protein